MVEAQKRSWVVVASVAVLVAAVGVAVLLVLVDGGSDSDEVTARDEGAVESADAESASGSASDGDEPSTPAATSEPLLPVSGQPPLVRIDPAWVGIIRSLAVDRIPYRRALDEAQDLSARGIPAEVLYSSNYSTMNGGYWVVYSGVFSSREAASAHCLSIQPQLSNSCYPREANGYRDTPLPS